MMNRVIIVVLFAFTLCFVTNFLWRERPKKGGKLKMGWTVFSCGQFFR